MKPTSRAYSWAVSALIILLLIYCDSFAAEPVALASSADPNTSSNAAPGPIEYPAKLTPLLTTPAGAPIPVLSFEALNQIKQALAKEKENAVFGPAFHTLCDQADAALNEPIVNITTDKKHLAPSGDPHDYYSVGPYWWPNPDTKDGLPYIRRDGQRNPEVYEYDRIKLSKMTEQVTTLAWAAYFSQKPVYAESAVKRLQTWFLDEKTRMNPHLEYGQAIPGICTGRGIGIIDTTQFGVGFLDALDALYIAFPNETKILRQPLQDWFQQYLSWLITSGHGVNEAGQHNNHGTAYDVQTARIALFLGLPDLARAVLDHSIAARIDTQIEPDGSQPHELVRTLSLGYTQGNLSLMLTLAAMGRTLNHPLTDYVSKDGRSIPHALDWLIPYYTGRQSWTWQQIQEIDRTGTIKLLRQAAWVYDKPYEKHIAEIAEISETQKASDRSVLLYPLEWKSPQNQ